MLSKENLLSIYLPNIFQYQVKIILAYLLNISVKIRDEEEIETRDKKKKFLTTMLRKDRRMNVISCELQIHHQRR